MPDKYELFLDKNKKVKLSADEQGNFFAEANDKRIKLGASGLENVDENGVASPVGADLTALDQSIIPDTNEVYDLGSAEKKFRHLYLSSNSLFVGDTKITSDPTTGALTTAVSDGQGGFADPAPVGDTKFYDWKGSTTNIAANDPINNDGINSKLSMEFIYNDMVIVANAANTGPIEVIWGNYLGNPNTSKTTLFGGIALSSGNYGYDTGFITDEDGDDLSAFLVNKMDEENLPILNFEFTLSAKLQIQDPVKAAQIPYFQQGQFNNLTNVTSIPLWTMTQGNMYAFKTATSNYLGHTRGIMMGSMADSNYDYNGNPGAAKVALWNLGTSSNPYSQPNVFKFNNIQDVQREIGSELNLFIDMALNNPAVNMKSADPTISSATSISDIAGYFDLQDGIVFDMLVNVK